MKEIKAFEAPFNWKTFYDDVVDKCEGYIKTGYWEGIDRHRLRLWLQNFHSDEEKYLSACMLDSMVFRTPKMINASFKHIATSIIPNFLAKHGAIFSGDLTEWLQNLKKGSDIPFRFIAIEEVDNKVGKSGSVIIRELQQVLDLAGHMCQKPSRIPKLNKDVKAIVLIDDFAGTGEQFCNFYIEKIKNAVIDKYKVLYVPLAAHEIAVKNIESKFPEVEVRPVELLSERDSFFADRRGTFYGDETNTAESAKSFYLKLCSRRNFGKLNYLLGKGDLSLTYAFSLSTPNNNLKLIYHNPMDGKWNHLLYRKR
ncbi:MAG: phosphoribosyltransferase-like protein [Psychrobium sp.]